MTYEYTSEVFALQNARIEMQAIKAQNRARIQAKYKARIAQEIAEADQSAELHFANLLKEAVDAGVPQSVLRKEVLRTNVWERWTYWRDLAEIQPERVLISNARAAAAEAAKPFRIEEDPENPFGWTAKLVVTRNERNEEIPPFEVRDFNVDAEQGRYQPWPKLGAYVDVATLWGDRTEFNRATAATIRSAYEAGILAEKEDSE